MSTPTTKHAVIRSLVAAGVALVVAVAGSVTASAQVTSFTGLIAPVVSGTVAVGKTLTATYDVSAVDPAPDTQYVEWFSSGEYLGTGDTLELLPSYVGKPLSAVLTVVKEGYGSASVGSSTTAAVATGTQSFTPAISGTTASGYTLSVKGLPSGATFTYSWKRSGKTAAVSTKSTYKLSSADVGHTVTITVTSTKAGYNTLSKASAKTATVVKPFSWHTPKITGTAKVGYKLTATTSAWSPKPTFSYQWYRNGVAISGATGSTRTLTSTDAGTSITVKMTGRKSGYLTTSKTSAATSVVAKGSITVKTPVVSGTKQAGHTLTITAYTPSTSGTTRTIQWYRDGNIIAGATATTFALKNVDAGKTISFKVTYAKAGYTSKVFHQSVLNIAKRSSSIADEKEYSPAHPTSNYPDLAAGIYIANNATADCYWVRDQDHDGENGDITHYSGAARWMVQIYDTDGAFWSSGCGSWIKYDGTGAQATTVSKDGMYRVGVDILAGVYQQSGVTDGCLVTFEANASNEDSAIVDGGPPADGSTITIDAAHAPFFTTWGCGTWTRVGDVPAVS